MPKYQPRHQRAGRHVEDWPNWATDGSLIIVDEIQRIWRPTNSASALPDGISRLETHRHRGLDFWIISQGPHLFHSNIRLLIGRHIHLVANWRGRSEYEWPECRQDVTRRTDAIVRPYQLPKQIFGLYKSSSLHTTIKKRPPLALYIFGIVLAMTAFFAFRAMTKIQTKMDDTTSSFDVKQLPTDTAPAVAGGNASLLQMPNNPDTPAAFPDFKPEIVGVPESAPAYRHLIEVKAAPILSACVLDKKKNKCKCYTTQATPYPTSDSYCREQVLGNRFNPYATPSAAPVTNEFLPTQPAPLKPSINPLQSQLKPAGLLPEQLPPAS